MKNYQKILCEKYGNPLTQYNIGNLIEFEDLKEGSKLEYVFYSFNLDGDLYELGLSIHRSKDINRNVDIKFYILFEKNEKPIFLDIETLFATTSCKNVELLDGIMDLFGEKQLEKPICKQLFPLLDVILYEPGDLFMIKTRTLVTLAMR